ncbi:hypothetical protein [Agrobacterium tumefaciens]|uniref:hypothetical protein n=1 Tax=Agrobacterium tumefaciens TaxID=358 RepID=UPI001FAAE7BA|nr:hypothetical protein [Agrobacterium tumefaciens]UNZ49309.1 hypothetical protein MLE07_07880 [Agrobacterium tumefaciens]
MPESVQAAVHRVQREMEEGIRITYAQKYNEQYKKFKAGAAQAASGTPVEELPFLTQGKRLELKALNIYTAEALAALDGNNLKLLGMGGRDLKTQAQRYLDNASKSLDLSSVLSENEDLKRRLAELEGKTGKKVKKGSTVPQVSQPEPETEQEATQRLKRLLLHFGQQTTLSGLAAASLTLLPKVAQRHRAVSVRQTLLTSLGGCLRTSRVLFALVMPIHSSRKLRPCRARPRRIRRAF